MNILYKKLATYYDLVYKEKDYKIEANYLDVIFKRYHVRDVLDVACGTGNHDKYLARKYNVIGVDLNNEILKVAMEKVKRATFYKMDMKNLKINKKFDAIICMFSSIAYNRSKNELLRTLKGFSDHLKEGGLLILDVQFLVESFKDNYFKITGFDTKEVSLAIFSLSKKQNRKALIKRTYILRENNKFMYFKEGHILGLMSLKEYIQCFNKSGFKVKVYDGFASKQVYSKAKKFNNFVFVGVKNGI